MKPCPFCNSNDVGYAYRTHPDGMKLSFISCSGCGANGPVRTYTSEYDDDESAAAGIRGITKGYNRPAVVGPTDTLVSISLSQH